MMDPKSSTTDTNESTHETPALVVLGQAVPTKKSPGLTLGSGGQACDDYERICWAEE